MTLITQTSELQAFCDRMSQTDVIAVDTEFMRERTYWPKLCLVQVAGGDEAAAIDPLAPGMDLAPLFDLLRAPHILKAFHAARQDLEIFHRLMRGVLPKPVFDTQVAAMVCGFGDQVSYETLVGKLAKARIDKSSRFTDWSLRPLSVRQIEYAIADVVHLLPVYRKLETRLRSSGRGEWLAEEMADLTDPANYVTDLMQVFRRVRSRSGNGRMLAVLRELAAWRERDAQARDIPRAWLLRDEALLEIAHHTPKTTDELARTRGMARKFAESATGAELLEAVARGLAVPEAEYPETDMRREMPRGVGAVADLLKVVLKMKSEDADVAQRLLASSEEVELIAAEGEAANVPALHGWRRQVFGEAAIKVRSGELAMIVEGRKLVLMPTVKGKRTGFEEAAPDAVNPAQP
ncbi:MAG: ribonuclease D [Rhodospirillales bacterium]|nr:ribonuclease D [Rhodospirillales bacterium]